MAARTDLPHARDHVLVKLSPGPHHKGLSDAGTAIHGRWRTHPVPPGRTPAETVDALLKRPGVETAELDYQFQIDPQPEFSGLDLSSLAAANDPGLPYQWHIPAVQATGAWAISSGAGVVVAVIDSGVSLGGEDLDCHTFVAPYNAITGTTGIAAVQDDVGHGTHVAGTVAQCTNNGVGVAGVAFDASLMPVKVLDGNGDGASSWLVRGIDWARAHGADVINLSLGCSCSSAMVDDAIEAAAADGVVMVAAAGNNNGSVLYPAKHPDVIAVGATDYDNQRASYSNWGSGLDLVAPGGHSDLFHDANGDGLPDWVLQETHDNGVWGYYFSRGTSMAAPHVSGAIAILLSKEPRGDRDTVMHALESTALDLGAAGYDTVYGYGLIQIHDALARTAGAFTDTPGHTFYNDILWMAGMNITRGCNPPVNDLFCPNDPVTRGQMAAFIARALGLKANSHSGFKDVPSSHTFFNDIGKLATAGITRGCNPPANTLYCPDDPVTRGQMSAFVVRALGLTANDHSGFGDVPSSNTFHGDIGKLATAGITRGCNPPVNDRFCPDEPITRGQLAAFFHRALD
jgi:hypothetical protein